MQTQKGAKSAEQKESSTSTRPPAVPFTCVSRVSLIIPSKTPPKATMRFQSSKLKNGRSTEKRELNKMLHHTAYKNTRTVPSMSYVYFTLLFELFRTCFAWSWSDSFERIASLLWFLLLVFTLSLVRVGFHFMEVEVEL